MKDDYLWDKTGEPDPEIEQLEKILGTLRYQPRPLELPQDLMVPRRRNYFPLYAIAASLLFALLAGGIWLRTRSRVEAPPNQVRVDPVEEKILVPEPPRNKSAANPPAVVVATHKHRNKPAASAPTQEALMAKQQLMLALRLTTEKLSMVQKKTQVRNQHKVG